jgi:phosphatidate cytidylyltransferase
VFPVVLADLTATSGGGQMTQSTVRVPNVPSGRAGRDLSSAIGVGLLLGVLIGVSLFIYRWVFGLFVAAAVVLGVLEFAGALARRGIVVPRVLVIAGAVAMTVSATFAGPLGLAIAATLAVAAVSLATLVVPGRTPSSPEGTGLGPRTVPDARDTAAAVFALMWIGLLAGVACLLLRPVDGSWRAFTLILVVVCSDTGGYIAGVLGGRHPMAPRISPKKSWEGLGGSVVLSVAAAIFAVPVLLHGPWWAGVVLGVLTVAAAVLGDLAESLIKRDLGVKDMSSLLPGHGGLLDRMDSILLSAPIVWLVLALFVAPPSGSAWL